MQLAEREVNLQLAAFVVTRLVVSTALRLMIPFLPAIARGLAVSLEAAALLVSVRSAMGLAGPLLGSAADHWGRRTGITAGLLLFVLGTLPMAFWPSYPVVLIGLVISGAGNIIVDSTIYAYLGDRFPYERRARAIAVVEIGWSGAFVVGIPLAGWLIARRGWNAPFLWLGLLGGLVLIMLRRLMPQDRERRQEGERPWANVGLMARRPVAWAGLLFTLLILTAHQSISIVYGAWMEDRFGLQVDELGAASTVLGLAGICGVLLVAFISDRLGKRTAIGLGIGINTLSALALPYAGQSLVGTLIVLFFFFLSFEFALISALSLMTELVPAARATLMAANVAALAGGDALGSAVGPWLYRWGITFSSGATAVINIAALVLLALVLRVGQPGRQPEGSVA